MRVGVGMRVQWWTVIGRVLEVMEEGRRVEGKGVDRGKSCGHVEHAVAGGLESSCRHSKYYQ